MTWLRIDDRADDLPRLHGLSDAAFRLWVHSMIFCGRQLTNGLVPEHVVSRLAPRKRVKRLIEELTRVDPTFGALWEADEQPGLFRVVHYLQWNQTRAEVERAQAAAQARKEQWQARQSARTAPEVGGGHEEELDRDLPAEDLPSAEPLDPSEARGRAGRRRPNADAGRKVPPKAAATSKPRHAVERVPNGAQSDPIQDPDPRSSTAECDQPPVGHAHTAEGAEEVDLGRDARGVHLDSAQGESATSPPRAEDACADPDAAEILAHLGAMPAPVRHLATPEHASRFASARMSGLTLEEIRTAISAAGLKLGRHRSAHPSTPETLDRLADHVGSFIANQRPLAARTVPPTLGEIAPVAMEGLLHRWCDMYQRTQGIAYTVTDEDRDTACDLLRLVEQAAAGEAARTGRREPERDDQIVEHWLRSYLADEGAAGYLHRARHALRYIKRHVATYGLPRTRRLAKCAAPPRTEAPLSAETNAAGAAQVAAACAGIGRGDGFDAPPQAPVRRRERA